MDKTKFFNLIIGLIGTVADEVTDGFVQVDVKPDGLHITLNSPAGTSSSEDEQEQDRLPLGGDDEKPATDIKGAFGRRPKAPS